MKKCIFLLLNLIANVLLLYGQDDTIFFKAGDPRANGDRFFDYTNVWIVSNDKGVQLGVWYDTLLIGKQEGTDVLIRKQFAKYVNGWIRKHLDVANRANMLPIQSMVITYAPGSLTADTISNLTYQFNSGKGKLQGLRFFNIEGGGDPSGILTRSQIELNSYFYDWHLWGILVSSFPLQYNFKTTFLAHTSTATTNSPFLWIRLQVTGSETIESRRWGNVDCWVVGVGAEVPWTLWIAKGKTVAPVQKIKIDQTASGGEITWWRAN